VTQWRRPSLFCGLRWSAILLESRRRFFCRLPDAMRNSLFTTCRDDIAPSGNRVPDLRNAEFSLPEQALAKAWCKTPILQFGGLKAGNFVESGEGLLDGFLFVLSWRLDQQTRQGPLGSIVRVAHGSPIGWTNVAHRQRTVEDKGFERSSASRVEFHAFDD
jgi:hypothetical protein